MSVERLVGLVRESVAAGVPQTADGLAQWATRRAPDLLEAARAFGDLAQRALVSPLATGAVPAHEDAPIANDLSGRLRLPLTAAQTAIAAARASGGVAAAPYQPAIGAATLASPPLYRRWWFWVLVTVGVAGAFMYHALTTYRANRAVQLMSPQTNPLPLLQVRTDDAKGLIGVRFRLGDKHSGAEHHGLFLWPRAGLATGDSEGMIGFAKELTAYREKPAFRVAGPMEIGTEDGRAVAVIAARDTTVSPGSGVMAMTFKVIGKPGSTPADFRIEGGETVCVLTSKGSTVDRRERCGIVPPLTGL